MRDVLLIVYVCIYTSRINFTLHPRQNHSRHRRARFLTGWPQHQDDGWRHSWHSLLHSSTIEHFSNLSERRVTFCITPERDSPSRSNRSIKSTRACAWISPMSTVSWHQVSVYESLCIKKTTGSLENPVQSCAWHRANAKQRTVSESSQCLTKNWSRGCWTRLARTV